MARDLGALFARADRVRAGGGSFTAEDIDRLIKRPRTWKPCVNGAHSWGLLPTNIGYRCTHPSCRVYSGHAAEVAACPVCAGPTCTTDGRCPKCGGVFPN